MARIPQEEIERITAYFAPPKFEHLPAKSDKLHKAIAADRAEFSQDAGFPVKPQKIVWDLREVLGPDDIAISDVGAHKMWMSRMYRAASREWRRGSDANSSRYSWNDSTRRSSSKPRWTCAAICVSSSRMRFPPMGPSLSDRGSARRSSNAAT